MPGRAFIVAGPSPSAASLCAAAPAADVIFADVWSGPAAAVAAAYLCTAAAAAALARKVKAPWLLLTARGALDEFGARMCTAEEVRDLTAEAKAAAGEAVSVAAPRDLDLAVLAADSD